MRLKEIILKLSPADRTSLAARYDVPPEKLETYFTQPDIVKNNYSILSKRLRQIVNHVFRANGLVEFEAFRKTHSVTKLDLKLLQERALIFSLPNVDRPKKIVLPLEYLFILDVPDSDPLSLISLLNNLQIESLKRIAQYNSLDCEVASKPICASVIYEYFIENIEETIISLLQVEKDILKFVIQYGGKISATEFFKKYRINSHQKASHLDITIQDLYGSEHQNRLSSVQTLFLKGLLVPIFKASSYSIQMIASPSETYQLAAEEHFLECETKKRTLAKRIRESVPDTPILSNEQQFIQDIKKVLLIVENTNPKVTQSGTPYKKELQKIYQSFKLDEEYIIFLFDYLSYMELIKLQDNQFVVTSSAEDFLNLPLKTIHLLSKNFLTHSSISMDEDLELNPNDIIKLILHILNDFKENFSKVSFFLEYAGYCSSLIRFAEAAKKQKHTFNQIGYKILKSMFWLGLIELKGDFEFVRLSAAGQYVIAGRIKNFQTHKPEEKFTVLSNNEIVAPFNTRFKILQQLASFSTINSMDVTIHFNLNKARLMQAYHKGVNIGDIHDFLKEYSKTPLPQTMLYLFQELEEKVGEIELMPASGYVKIRDPYLLEQIKIHLRQYIFEIIGKDRIILRPHLNLSHLEKQLKQKGYFLKSNIQPTDSARLSSSQLSDLLKLIEPPKFAQEDLNFPNPAYDRDDIGRLLLFAIKHQLQVKIEYLSESSTTTVRKINPKRLDSNMLEAYCYTRESSRIFRVDRVQWAELVR